MRSILACGASAADPLRYPAAPRDEPRSLPLRTRHVPAPVAADCRDLRCAAASPGDRQPDAAGPGDHDPKGNPSLAELARPTLRLAGLRVDPKNNGPHRTATNGGGYRITLKRIADGREIPVSVPPQANMSNVNFSPDGARLAFMNTKDAAIELWIADATTGSAE